MDATTDPRYFVRTDREIYRLDTALAAHQLAADLAEAQHETVQVFKYGEGMKPRSYGVGVYHPGKGNSILPVAPTGDAEIDAITVELIFVAQHIVLKRDAQPALF